jgi:hypothetical protein
LSRAAALAQPVCAPDGDVNEDERVTPGDAHQAFQHVLGLVTLSACAQIHANVFDPGSSGITAADVVCIFQHYLGLSSCLDTLRPVADAGPDQEVNVGTMVQLNGNGSRSPNITPLTFQWTLTAAPANSTAALSAASPRRRDWKSPPRACRWERWCR